MDSPKKSSKSSKSTVETGLFQGVRLRPRVWISLLFLVALGFGGHLLWQQFAPHISQHPQYLVTADRIHITPPPPWVRSDIKTEVLRDAGLLGRLSVLDEPDRLHRQIKDAFEFHPWVAVVGRVSKRLPASLEIELEYRQPIAAVETTGGGRLALLPVDRQVVRLPEADLTEVEKRYLPRISGITGRPAIGATWNDPRVTGGTRLVAGLRDVWQELRLVEIIPSSHPRVRGEVRFYTYEIITSGGTRIAWGAAPGLGPVDEAPFGAKRERLLQFATSHGQLDSIHGPEIVDVQRDLVVTPRTAKRDATDEENESTTK